MIMKYKLKIFENLLRIRLIEEKIAEKYKENKMRCPTHLSIGQEAVSAALSILLRKKDFAVSSHRCHAHYLSKGGSLKKMIAELYGKKTGCSSGKGGSMHLIDLQCNFMGSSSIVGNSIPIGVGLGLSIKVKKQKNLSFIFFGDGALEQGVFFEAVNFAIIKKLPVIFICENNLYSVYSPMKVRQPKRDISKMVNSLGIKSYSMDGNNALDVYKNLKKIIKKVRKSSNPIFLEFKTYRWREHCGPNIDDNLGYRTKKEILFWKKKDPLKIIEKNLGKISSQYRLKIENKINSEINKAFKFAENSPFPNKKEYLQGVYAK
tara:strand:+ start:2445 stop:3401 length:957 start_codon:yes stop_codon:yes gene_type:complete